MDNTKGLKLIQELYLNPSEFNNQGKTYELLQEYFSGLPLETIRPLICHDVKEVRRAAVWIVSELGIEGRSLLNDVIKLISDEDRYIKYHVLEIIAVCSVEENIKQYFKIFPFLEYDDDIIRILVMRLISNTDIQTLKDAHRFFEHKDSYHKIHHEGLSNLLNIDQLPIEKVNFMIQSDEPLTRKYGIIAAKKLFVKHPNIIINAKSHIDSDISKFAHEVVNVYSR